MKRLGIVLLLCALAACGRPEGQKVESASLARWSEGVVWPVTTTTVTPLPPVALPTPPVARKRAVGHQASPKASRGTGTGRCGGDLPPCWVMNRESGGDPNAYNPTGCSGRGCYGKWQCDPRSCDGTGTEEQQDAEAARLWDHGRGCSHWAAC